MAKATRWWAAGVAVAAFAVVLAVALRTPDSAGSPVGVLTGVSPELADPEAPPTVPHEDSEAALSPPETTDGAAPCDGCLSAHAAQDVVESLLFHLGVNHLDIRAELVADIPWLTPDRRHPPLPPELLDAPPDYPYGRKLPYWVDAKAAEIWVVWYQTGWVSHEALEDRIRVGHFPPSARSWPPLKVERYVLVNARTGEVDETALMPLYGGLDQARSAFARHTATNRARLLLEEASRHRKRGQPDGSPL